VFAEIFVHLVDSATDYARLRHSDSVRRLRQQSEPRYWRHTPEVTVVYRIDRQRMRSDWEYPLKKPPSVCRDALFGDTFFVGCVLELKDTFVMRLVGPLVISSTEGRRNTRRALGHWMRS